MADDLTKRRPQDATRINTRDEWELDFWCQEFNCAKAELIDALYAAGNSVSAVKSCLGRRPGAVARQAVNASRPLASGRDMQV